MTQRDDGALTSRLARCERETDAFDGEAKRKLLQQLPPFPRRSTGLESPLELCYECVCVCVACVSVHAEPSMHDREKNREFFSKSPQLAYMRGHLSSSSQHSLPLRTKINLPSRLTKSTQLQSGTGLSIEVFLDISRTSFSRYKLLLLFFIYIFCFYCWRVVYM